MSNKKTRILIISILAAILIIAGSVFAVISIKNANDKRAQEAAQNTPAAKKASADSQKMEGVKASTSGDTEKAKQLLLEAQAEYKALGDTNNVVDTDAQLYFIEHPSTPPAAVPTAGN